MCKKKILLVLGHGKRQELQPALNGDYDVQSIQTETLTILNEEAIRNMLLTDAFNVVIMDQECYNPDHKEESLCQKFYDLLQSYQMKEGHGGRNLKMLVITDQKTEPFDNVHFSEWKPSEILETIKLIV